MFREASVYVLKGLSAEKRAAYGLRVLVMQRWPRGVSKSDVDVWLPSAAPEPEVLVAYRDGTFGWLEFARAYQTSQLQAQACRMRTYQGSERSQVLFLQHSALDQLHILERQYCVVTLLCWETDEHCHRFLLKDLLELRRLSI